MAIQVSTIWVSLTIFLAIVVKSGEYHELQLFFSPQLILDEKQYWRIFTSVLYSGRFSVPFVLQKFFEFQLNSTIEQRYFNGHTLEYFIFVMLGCTLVIICRFLEWVTSPFLCSMSHSVIIYVGSKVLPDLIVQIFGIPLTMRYVPIAFGILQFYFGGLEGCREHLIACCIGHILWYLREVFPVIAGWSPLRLRM